MHVDVLSSVEVTTVDTDGTVCAEVVSGSFVADQGPSQRRPVIAAEKNRVSGAVCVDRARERSRARMRGHADRGLRGKVGEIHERYEGCVLIGSQRAKSCVERA